MHRRNRRGSGLLAMATLVIVTAAVAVDLEAQRGGGGRGGGGQGGARGGGQAPGRGAGGRGAEPPAAVSPRPDRQDDGPLPTFRGGVTLVQIDASVTDEAGHPVSGLTADDFEILERGQARDILAFAAVDLPVPQPDLAPSGGGLEPDAAVNTAPPGRTYLFALDEVAPDRALRARAMLRRFIEDHMGPNDLAAVALTGRGLASSGQDFTSNKRLLLEAIDRFSGAFDTPAAGRPSTSSGPQLAASLRRLAEFLATMPGRKVMVLVSEGLDGLDPYEATDYRGGALTPGQMDAHAAIAAATRGNVTIYPIDPRGLTTETAEAESFDTTNLDARADLSALADVTGGFAVAGTNNVPALLDRLVRENSAYYTIGFESRYDRTDGRFVRVDVRVRRPGLQVRARNGYVAPLDSRRVAPEIRADARSAAVVDAVASPVAVGGVPMRVTAASYRTGGSDASVVVAVEFDVSALGFTLENGTLSGRVEVTYLATDASGRVRPGRRHDVNVALEGLRPGDTSERWARTVSVFELPRGRYQLRVGAGSPARAGSVVYDFEVPDYSDRPLALSHVALMATGAAGVPTLVLRNPLGRALPGPPAAGREFSAAETLWVYVETYQSGRRDAPPQVTVDLRRADGSIARASPDQQASPALEETAGSQGVTAVVPLAGLAPGAYVLHVGARAADTGGVATRTIPVRIR